MENDKSFLGRGWAFPPEFNKTSSPTEMAYQEDDIRQSLIILFSTKPNERIHRAYGCNLQQFMFEPITETIKTQIRDVIEQAILLYEPRIILEKITLNTQAIEQDILLIEIEYTIRSTNKRSNMVYPFYLREGTDL